jgi:hypothetical protein
MATKVKRLIAVDRRGLYLANIQIVRGSIRNTFSTHEIDDIVKETGNKLRSDGSVRVRV